MEREKFSSDQIPEILQLLEEKTSRLKKLEHWWPSYLEEPKKILPSLLVRFIELRGKFPEPKPIFLDCGCGDGMVMVLAGCAGFESYGIEIDEKPASIAQDINFQAFRRGLVCSQGKIAVGSYYISQLADKLKEKAWGELERCFSEQGRLETERFENFEDLVLFLPKKLSSKTREEKMSYILGEVGPNPYHQLGLLKETQEGLSLMADLVYCYPADFFFDSLFFEQFGMVSTKDNFLIATLVINGESLEKRGNFYKKFSLPISSNFYPKMRIDVFAKRSP